MKALRIALIFSQSGVNETLSYQHGWPKALLSSKFFECTEINLANISTADSAFIIKRLNRGGFDAIVMLHSVYSNQKYLRGLLYWGVALCRVPKVYFIGNEYKLMPEKMKFCRRLGVTCLISQSNEPKVLEIYRKSLNCYVTSLPNTGFDPSVFHPKHPLIGRSIDIGYRAYDSPWYLGNNEKTEISDFFREISFDQGLKVDISLDSKDRFNTSGYAAFLNKCRGQLGTESGGDYFELDDRTRKKVYEYTRKNAKANWVEVRELFFKNYGPSIPMRIISGRQIEAAACKTVQILFAGDYSGYFYPDFHYLSLNKDFSNIEEVLEKFRDDALCDEITKNAYDLALAEFTYDRLVYKLHRILRESI